MTELNRSGSPCRIELLSQRIFVLQSFQPLRLGFLLGGREHKNLRRIFLLAPAIEDRALILSQRLEDVF